MSEKAKNEKVTKPTISPINFVLLWVAVTTAMTYFGAGLFFWFNQLNFVENILRNNPDYFLLFALLASLLTSAGTALIQKWVLRLSFGRSFNGWVWASLLGTAASFIPIITAPDTTTPIYVLQSALLAIPLAWVLRKQVKHSWLLVLSRMLAGFIGISLANAYSSDFTSLALGVALPSAIIALNLLWFFRGILSQQNTSASATDEQHERLLDKLEENPISDDESLEEAQASS